MKCNAKNVDIATLTDLWELQSRIRWQARELKLLLVVLVHAIKNGPDTSASVAVDAKGEKSARREHSINFLIYGRSTAAATRHASDIAFNLEIVL